MSHRESGQIGPFITDCTPKTFAAAETISVTIDGVFFSPSMDVSCDSGLGTISNVVVTQPTATTSRAVFDLTVLEPVGITSKTIKVSNGGVSGSNSVQTVTHGFTPESLFNPTTPDGAFWDSSDASKNTFHSNNGLSQWDSSSGATGAFPYGSVATSAATTFPNSARGFSGVAKTNNQDKGFDGGSSGHSLTFSGPGNAWSVGFVLYISQSVIDSGTEEHAGFFVNGNFTLGYKGSYGTNHIFLNTKYHSPSGNASHANLSQAMTTGGVYTIVGTCDGTTTSQRLYINGVSQGPITVAMDIDPAITGKSFFSKYAPNVVVGDVLIIERELTSDEVTALNSYWTNKFT